jgi:hypothetical protein
MGCVVNTFMHFVAVKLAMQVLFLLINVAFCIIVWFVSCWLCSHGKCCVLLHNKSIFFPWSYWSSYSYAYLLHNVYWLTVMLYLLFMCNLTANSSGLEQTSSVIFPGLNSSSFFVFCQVELAWNCLFNLLPI